MKTKSKDLKRLEEKLTAWQTKSANAWTYSNNSGGSDHHDALELGYAKLIEQLCFEHDILVDWPGLYPCFKYEDIHFYDVPSLINWMRKNQK